MAAKGLRVLVCGGRDFDNRELAFAALDALHAKTPFALVIQGGARGADRIARDWAEARRVEWLEMRADWSRYGNAAGPIRNATMLEEGRPDFVVAFEGGRGTADMVRRAQNARVRVLRIETLRDAGVDVEAETNRAERVLREAAKPDAGWLPDGTGPWRSGRQASMKGRE